MNVQRYAKAAAWLFLLTIVFGFLGEVYIPSRFLVTGDAEATARNILAAKGLYRFGFAAYLVEALCDIGLALIFYVILKPVNRNLALLTAFLGLVSTAIYAVAEMFYFAPLLILSGKPYLSTFTPAQLSSLSMLSLQFFGTGSALFMCVYGTGWVLRGYLIARSGYLPKWLGILFMVAGFGFILKNFTLVLAPAYASDVLLMPMGLSGVILTVWMFVKGVDVAKWEARAT